MDESVKLVGPLDRHRGGQIEDDRHAGDLQDGFGALDHGGIEGTRAIVGRSVGGRLLNLRVNAALVGDHCRLMHRKHHLRRLGMLGVEREDLRELFLGLRPSASRSSTREPASCVRRNRGRGAGPLCTGTLRESSRNAPATRFLGNRIAPTRWVTKYSVPSWADDPGSSWPLVSNTYRLAGVRGGLRRGSQVRGSSARRGCAVAAQPMIPRRSARSSREFDCWSTCAVEPRTAAGNGDGPTVIGKGNGGFLSKWWRDA